MNAIKNYGFSEDLIEIEPEAYILGVNSKLPNIIYRPDGQWGDFLPEFEKQHESDFDTFNCTAFGTLNQIEIMMKALQL